MSAATGAWKTLWPIFIGPSIWAIHFLTVYIFAAVFCAKMGAAGDFALVRLWIGGTTLVALMGIGLVAVRGFRQWRVEYDLRQDKPTAVDRRQLLGQAAILLCALSAVGVIYHALPAVFIASCR